MFTLILYLFLINNSQAQLYRQPQFEVKIWEDSEFKKKLEAAIVKVNDEEVTACIEDLKKYLRAIPSEAYNAIRRQGLIAKRGSYYYISDLVWYNKGADDVKVNILINYCLKR